MATITPRRTATEDIRSSSGDVYRIFISAPQRADPPAQGYPTLFVLDGNAWFGVAAEVARLNRPDALVVGVGYPTEALLDFKRRRVDYVPFTADPAVHSPHAERFMGFLNEELVLRVRENHEVDPARMALLGHSLGGLFVLHHLFTRAQSFASYVAMSPSIWRDDRRILKEEDAFYANDTPAARRTKATIKVMISAGSHEQFVDASYEAELRRKYELHPGRPRGQTVDQAVADYKLRAPQARMVDNAREMATRLRAQGVAAQFVAFEGEDHMSVVPPAINRAVPYVLASLRRRALAVLPLLLLGISGWPTGSRASEALPPPLDERELRSFVDGVVAHAMRRDHIAGVAVAVVQAGRPVLIRGYGYAGFSPVRRVDAHRTLFRIASISKTFTWTLLMQQAEAGRVDLGQPVNAYLPDELELPDQEFQRPILLRDLMAHAAGFEEKEFGASRVADPDAFRPLHVYLQAHRPDRVRPPGLEPAYSNYGVSLIGPVLTGVLGTDYESLAERYLIDPLGLKSTTFRQPYTARRGLAAPMPADLLERVSDGFTWRRGTFRREAFEILETVPAGSVSTTAADMTRYMLMHLQHGEIDGRRIYGPETAAAFRTPILQTAQGVNGWAHGFAVTTLPGGYSAYGHGGTTLVFYSNMVLVPKLDLGVFVVANTNTARALRDSLAAHVVERFYPTGEELAGLVDPERADHAPADPGFAGPGFAGPGLASPGPAARPDVYEGRYVTTRRAYSGLQKFLGLMEPMEVKMTRGGDLLISNASSVQRWAPQAERFGVFHSVQDHATLTFSFGPDGRATGWTHPNGVGVYERMSLLYSPTLLAGALQLALLAAVLVGFAAIGRWARSPRAQRVSIVLALGAGLCWLVAWAGYRMTAAELADLTTFFYAWPSNAVLLSSSVALLAAALSASALAGVALAWRTSIRAGSIAKSWPVLATTSIAVALDAALALQLGLRGGLQPWLS